jgi:hypothetical protein
VPVPFLTRARRGAALVSAVLVVGGCGVATQQQGGGGGVGNSSPASGIPTFHAHPQAVAPMAGGGASEASSAGGVSVSSAASRPLPQPSSLAEIKAQLAQSGLSADSQGATLTPQGLAIAPLNAPPQVQEVIDAGNEIAHLPYRWGGGHMTFVDTAYDCSGSLSFVLAAAGLLRSTMTSGELANWGESGPGKWITIFANAGHTFAYIAGLRFDTVALAETGSRWSNRAADESHLHSFVIRHPPGM